MSDESPDPTRVSGAPHPRDTARLIGQATAEAAFLEAFTIGRLHHAWLLTGPRGVGKATFAWRLARFLLATPDPDADDMFGAPAPTSVPFFKNNDEESLFLRLKATGSARG